MLIVNNMYLYMELKDLNIMIWGNYFQEGAEVKMETKIDSAYSKSLDTVVDWIHREVNTSKTQVLFRTYAPVHFRGGDWRSGGSCHLEMLPELGSSLVPPQSWARYSIFVDVLSAHSNTSNLQTLDILNVTIMTSRRKDGHSSLYNVAGPAPLHRQDCSHWCLLGVPDAWNELLYALFLKHESAQIWKFIYTPGTSTLFICQLEKGEERRKMSFLRTYQLGVEKLSTLKGFFYRSDSAGSGILVRFWLLIINEARFRGKFGIIGIGYRKFFGI